MLRLVDDGGFTIQFGEQIEFTIDGSGQNIWTTALNGDAAASASTYLYGLVLGLALYLQGKTCLHASAVAIDGRAILFVGDAGYGKSSLAAAFAVQGFPLISDDLAVLLPQHGTFWIPPALPAIRLRPDFTALLFGEEGTLPEDDAQWDKRRFEIGETSSLFIQEPKQLAAIYLLSRANLSGAGNAIAQLTPREALLNLSRFGYLPNLMDSKMHRAEFEMLASLVLAIPVRQLPRLDDAAGVPDLCRRIVTYLRSSPDATF